MLVFLLPDVITETIHYLLQGVYFLFGRSGVGAPVGVNRDWRALVSRLEEAYSSGMEWQLHVGFSRLTFSQKTLTFRNI
jgi:hypothetical protein